jgi:serine protease Do
MIRLIAAGMLAAIPCMAQDKGEEPTPAALAEIAKKLVPSLVQVEYRAQYDKGESPAGDRWAAWRQYYAGTQDASGQENDSWDQVIKEERPALRGGYLIGPTTVFTADPMLHPRFIKSIDVRFGDQLVAAKPKAYGKDDAGWTLELSQPLKGATALTFDPSKAGPFFSVVYERRDGGWAARVAGVRTSVTLTDDGRAFASNSGPMVIVDKSGAPVSFSGAGVLAADGSWRKKPEAWDAATQEEMAGLLSKLESETGASLLRVSLVLRSPRQPQNQAMHYRFPMGGPQDDQVATEWNGIGLLTDENTVLVLANLKPKVMGRLERIKVFSADGKEHAAQFVGTMKDWGAFVAKLDSPLRGAPKLAPGPITQCRGKLLLKAEVEVRGETRLAYFSRERIGSYYTRFKGDVYPAVAASSVQYSPYGQTGGAMSFLFNADGTLVGIPVERREKVTTEERWGGMGESIMVPAAILSAVLAEGSKAYDAENRPLSEQEENRLAWLGVELQALDPELARANNVMDQSRGGQTGAIVTFVYSDSPATKAGIEVGDIILRLHVEGQPQPLEVQMQGMDMFGGMFDQMWTMMDQMPEDYFDQMPKPWGAAETTLTRALTDIGFGTPFTAEVFRDGKVSSKAFKVEEGPRHYDSAKRFKSEAAGMTVRDMTYEVRRFFQLTPEDPGVIVSKVEKGSKVAVAGIKPLEQITSVNDAPVRNVGDLEKALAAGGELRLSVKRMREGRTVKIKLDPAKPEKPKENP